MVVDAGTPGVKQHQEIGQGLQQGQGFREVLFHFRHAEELL
jgi:hypothetical protein